MEHLGVQAKENVFQYLTEMLTSKEFTGHARKMFGKNLSELMKRNKPFKYAIKYSVVWPFVALARTAEFLINPFIIRKTKR